MDYLYWIIIILLFVVAFVGLIYPIIPSVVFLLAGFVLYGVFYSFEPFNLLFWSVQALFVILLFGADYIANIIGVKKYGGSKAGVWGSTIGLLIGPFIIPVIGIIIGPFAGAFLAELIINRRKIKEAAKIGFGSVIGFISSVVTKAVIQIVMVVYFFVTI
ncbi:hypothetical protein SAMN05192533_10254 [Mesobacillus persicus]|uniref:DUF456 domain-containing protein n=1 Tax=Mesobacillus persicus TaxID=930146 RepID=A0A1H7X5E8_9BACI|nr:DUF456 family protein [Mesobacillus persicus]SEM28943.1 hypothetical protein SAMN05192533_10254 [Mesobacillus persicus]